MATLPGWAINNTTGGSVAAVIFLSVDGGVVEVRPEFVEHVVMGGGDERVKPRVSGSWNDWERHG